LDGSISENSSIPPQTQLGNTFHVEKLLRLPEGAVIIDLTGVANTVEAQASRSNFEDEILESIANGNIVTMNGFVLSTLAQNHALLHAVLGQDTGLPTIPTTYRSESGRILVTQRHYAPATIKDSFMHKLSGLVSSHAGKGVSVVDSEAMRRMQANMNPSTEFFQPIIIPPQDQDGQRYIRDCRVYNIGGRPVVGIIRRAAEPLTKDIIRGRAKLTDMHFPTHANPGVIEDIPPQLWRRLTATAERISKNLLKAVQNSDQSYSPISPAGYYSTDFLLSADGTPLLTDFDLVPGVRPQVVSPVAEALANYAVELARAGDRERCIVLAGETSFPIVKQTLQNLRSREDYDPRKVILQERLKIV
jgi:hypothetical protein